MIESEDIIVWPDGVSCWGDEYQEMTHRSDDVRVLKPGTQEYQDAREEMEEV